MKKIKGSYKKEFETILETEKFELLEPFKSEKKWSLLSTDEKELLGVLILLQAEKKFYQGLLDETETDLNIVKELARDNADILYKHAEFYADTDKELYSFEKAVSLLEHVLTLNPLHPHSNLLLATLFIHKGGEEQDLDFIEKAICHFKQAEQGSLQGSKWDKREYIEFLWEYGAALFLLARIGEEPFDYIQSVGQFRKAAANGASHPKFWSDYASLLLSMYYLFHKEENLMEAIGILENAVHQAPQYSENWFLLGCAYQQVYQKNIQETHFEKACHAFEESLLLNPDYEEATLSLGKLLLNHGKCTRNLQYVKASIDTLLKVSEHNASSVLGLTLLADAEMFYGGALEDLFYLRDAEAKIKDALKIESQNVHAIFTLGSICNELGNYFGEETYYLDAIKHFEGALKIEEKSPLLWYGLAMANFFLGDSLSNFERIELSLYYFAKVMEYGGGESPQAWCDYAVALMKLACLTGRKKHFEEAVALFEKMVEVAQEISGEMVAPEWLYHYGTALDFLGDVSEDAASYYEKSIQVLTKAIQIEPHDLNIRYQMGLSLAHLGECVGEIEILQAGLNQFEGILQQDPEDAAAMTELGLILLNIAFLTEDPAHPERTEELLSTAHQNLLRAVSLGVKEALYHLGCLFAKRGKEEQAFFFLEKAREAMALPSIGDLMQDEWLSSLIDTPAFTQFIARIGDCQEEGEAPSL